MSIRSSRGEYIPDFLVDYVKCIDLRKVLRPVWRVHRNEYVFYASLLALYYAKWDRLRWFSQQIARRYRVSYRRLEYYAEYTGMVDTYYGKGYGKAIEVTFYAAKETPRRKRYTIEGRLFAPAPLFVDPVALGHNNTFMNIVERLISIALEMLGFPPLEEHDVYEVDGVRDVIEQFKDNWCNLVQRIDLTKEIVVEFIKHEHYGMHISRHYEYEFPCDIYTRCVHYQPFYELYLETHRVQPLEIGKG